MCPFVVEDPNSIIVLFELAADGRAFSSAFPLNRYVDQMRYHSSIRPAFRYRLQMAAHLLVGFLLILTAGLDGISTIYEKV